MMLYRNYSTFDQPASKKLNENVDIKRIIDNIYVNKRLLCIIPSTLKIKRPLN